MFNINLSAILKRHKLLLCLAPMAVIAVFSFLNFAGIATVQFGQAVFAYMHEFAIIGAAIFFFAWGFEKFRCKRLIENTPTSKIRSIAMGFAEVCGLAVQKAPLKSPLALADCVYYKFLVEREQRGSKGQKSWVTVNSGASTNYFYVDDNTGKLLVDPLAAEMMLVKDYEEIKNAAGSRMRYSEWNICPRDYVYALGSVKKFKDASAQRRDRILERLRQMKTDKENMKIVDANGDGQISAEEWDEARKKIEQQVFEEELSSPPSQEDDLIMAKGEIEETFIITDRDEKEIASKLGYIGLAAILVSGLVIILMSGSVLARLGFLSSGLAIDWQALYNTR